MIRPNPSGWSLYDWAFLRDHIITLATSTVPDVEFLDYLDVTDTPIPSTFTELAVLQLGGEPNVHY